MNTSKMVDTFKYYSNQFDKISKIPYIQQAETHHYAILSILTIIETQFSTYFILPIISAMITQQLFIANELKNRVVQKCVGDEMDCTDGQCELDIEERNKLFMSSYKSAKSTGFLYTRGVLIIRSIVLMFLIYYATLGLYYS